MPNHIDEKRIINAIDLSKDVDGFHPMHSGMLMNGQAILEPCTPKGIIRLIEETNKILKENAVVIGRSNIVGKPGYNASTKECNCHDCPFQNRKSCKTGKYS